MARALNLGGERTKNISLIILGLAEALPSIAKSGIPAESVVAPLHEQTALAICINPQEY